MRRWAGLRRTRRRGVPSCLRPRPLKRPELRSGGGGGGASPIWRHRLTSPEDVAEPARREPGGRRKRRVGAAGPCRRLPALRPRPPALRSARPRVPASGLAPVTWPPHARLPLWSLTSREARAAGRARASEEPRPRESGRRRGWSALGSAGTPPRRAGGTGLAARGAREGLLQDSSRGDFVECGKVCFPAATRRCAVAGRGSPAQLVRHTTAGAIFLWRQ